MKKIAKILVVDDEKDTRELIATVLADEGYSITIADNGENALSLVKSERFDLVITDLKMPVMDGMQFLLEIRRIASTTNVIMVTAFAEVESYINAMSLGAIEYLPKPLLIKELKKVVHHVLNKKDQNSTDHAD
jgi:two-component system, response regulator, stage 0 sporulation protein F